MDPQLLLWLTLLGGVLPGAIALVTLFLLWMWHAHRSNMKELESADAVVSDGPRWLLPVLLALGAIACDLVINSGMQIWPRSATERYVHVFLLLGLVGFAEGLYRWPAVVVLIARAMGYAAAVWMLAGPYVQSEILTNQELIAWMALAAVGGGALAHHTDHAFENTKAWHAGLVLIIAFAGLMPILFATGWATGPMMLIGVIGVLVNVSIVGLIFQRVRVSRGGVSVLVGMLIALLVGSGIQNEPDSIPTLALLMLLPLAASVPGRDRFASLLTRVGAVVLLLGIVGAMVQWQNNIELAADPQSEDPYADYSE